MEIKSKEISEVEIESLIYNPKNNNIHPKEQIDRLAKLIKYQGFRNPIVVSRRTGFVVSGHGRIDAAKQLGMKTVPVMYQDFENEAQEYAYLTSDNAIASWSELDLSMVNSEMIDFGPDFDLDLLGLKNFTLDPSEMNYGSGLSDEEKEELDNYSKKIASPVYTPKKDTPPPTTELYSIEKYESLVKEIKDRKLPKDIELFLISAASRHIVFNYENIAEFYCHQHSEIQDLMEKSALVIVDFGKAIENGFVKLTEEIKEIMEQNNIEVDDE